MYQVLLNLLLLFTTVNLFTMVNDDTECLTVVTHDDRWTNKNKLRIVQYNVEWLYGLPVTNPGNGCTWKNMTEATIHMDYVTDAVKDLNVYLLCNKKIFLK